MRSQETDTERIAGGSSASDIARADGSGGTSNVLDNDRLTERDAHGLRQDTRHRVCRAAGGERHHNRDGARWKSVRPCIWGGGERGSDARVAVRGCMIVLLIRAQPELKG
jgi:hypothetical protein